MKRIIALLLALVLALSLTACGKKEEPLVMDDGNNSLAIDTPPVEETQEDPLSHEFTQYGNGKIKIVGAEFTQDDYGDDLLRIYYDYTNTDDTANGHYLNTALEFISITQDGNECNTYTADSEDYFIVPEDLNDTNYVQPDCTTRNTILVACDPNGGNVKVSCFLMIGGWVFNANEVEPFEFEIDTKNLMGAPEAYVLPAITDPKYTADMSASGKYDYPLESEISINSIELTKDYDGRDVIRVNLTVTNNGEEALTPALMCLLELYQDGVSLPWVNAAWDMDSDIVTDGDLAYEEDLSPGETVECSALFYPRNQNPVEAVIENVNAELCLGARFDVKALYEAAPTGENRDISAAVNTPELVGTWLQRDSDWDDTFIFNADGTGMLISGPEYPFNYSVSGDTLTLTYGPDDDEDFTFTVDGNLLTLIDMWDEELLLDKQTEQAAVLETEETETSEEPEASEDPVVSEAEDNPLLEQLIGKTWGENESGYYETFHFNEDGTGLYTCYDGGLYEFAFEYEVEGDYVEIEFDDGDYGSFWFRFEDEYTMYIRYDEINEIMFTIS